MKNKARLPTDANGRTVEVPFVPGQSMTGVPFSAAVGAMTSTFTNKNVMVRIVATQPAHYRAVESSANAAVTDHYIPANTPYDIVLDGDEDRIGVIGLSGTAGLFYASERKSN